MTKHELLPYLAAIGQANAFQLADAFGEPYPTAAMTALRLTRQGLLSRQYDPAQGVYLYALTEQGFSRLDYFTSHNRQGD